MKSLDILKRELEEALKIENYEECSKINDYLEDNGFTVSIHKNSKFDIQVSIKKQKVELPVIKIGNQTWVTENLNNDHFLNGDLIYEAKTRDEWLTADQNGVPAWCYCNNAPENGSKFGKLYNGHAVVDSRGLAPEGYRIPSFEDFIELGIKVGISFNPDLGEYSFTKDQLDFFLKDGANNFGFQGVLCGIRNSKYGNNDFSGLKSHTGWWTIDENHYIDEDDIIDDLLVFRLSKDEVDSIMHNSYSKSCGYSIRLMKDKLE